MKMGDEKNKGVNSEKYFVSTRNINIIRSKIFYLVGWYLWFVCTVATLEVSVISREWCELHIKQKNSLTQMSKHIFLNYPHSKKNNVVGWKGPNMFVTNSEDVFSNASGLDFYKSKKSKHSPTLPRKKNVKKRGIRRMAGSSEGR